MPPILREMANLPKVRTLWILGLMLVWVGALFHSHSEDWAMHEIATTLTRTGKTLVVDYPLDHLFADMGIALMGLGSIAFTLGLIGWLYPPGDDRRS